MFEKIKNVKKSDIIFYVFISAIVIFIMAGNIPLGFVYDLFLGKGEQTGEKPHSSLAEIKTLNDFTNSYIYNKPVTVKSDTFVFAPLLKLRDLRAEGEHRTSRRSGNQRFYIKKYIHLNYPITKLYKLFYLFCMASLYNPYYIIKLEDDNYIAVFFDNYKMLNLIFRKELKLPAGYVRRADSSEITMLKKLETNYAVNTKYVLDMYNNKKIHYAVDILVRLFISIVFLFIAIYIKSSIEERKIK